MRLRSSRPKPFPSMKYAALHVCWMVLLAGLAVLLVGCSPDASSLNTERTWTEADGYRWAPLEVAGSEPGFTLLDSTDTGVGFVNRVTGEMVARNRHLMDGAGVAIGDVDGDDWPDLYFTRADGPNALYLNQGGFRFEPVAGAGGAALPGSIRPARSWKTSTGTAPWTWW